MVSCTGSRSSTSHSIQDNLFMITTLSIKTGIDTWALTPQRGSLRYPKPSEWTRMRRLRGQETDAKSKEPASPGASNSSCQGLSLSLGLDLGLSIMRPKPSRVRVAGGSSAWQLDSMTWGLGAALFPDPHFDTWLDATRPVSWAIQIAAQVLPGMYKAMMLLVTGATRKTISHTAWLQSEDEDKEAICHTHSCACEKHPSKLLEHPPEQASLAWLCAPVDPLTSAARLRCIYVGMHQPQSLSMPMHAAIKQAKR